ncbi:MAG: DUF1223 domain-containing protein [Rhodoblastus sp.]
MPKLTPPRLILAAAVLFASLAAANGSATAAAAAARPKGVIELFTSQGCSSCPPADKFLGELSRDTSLIVLSMPVDYWDYIGWKDTLASPQCTARQKDYAAARGDAQIYTPQIIIDGVTQVLGADRGATLMNLEEDRSLKGVMSVDVAANVADGVASVDIGAGADENAAVWLMEVEPSVTVKVGRGENAGHTLTYVNVVRKMTRLGAWQGRPAHFEAPAPSKPDHFYVALLQAGSPDRPGAILGAATTR